MQDQLDTLSDVNILGASKQRDKTLKLATKNAVDCNFSLNVIPEIKKDIEIGNFGKQLKNLVREELNTAPKPMKQKKSTKKVPKSSTNRQSRPPQEPRTCTNKDKPSPNHLNHSQDTELSTPVCISAKTHFFDKKMKPPATAPETRPKTNKAPKKEVNLPPQPKTITTQVLNSRNAKTTNKLPEPNKPNTSSFNYPKSKVMEKLNQFHAQNSKLETMKKPTEASGKWCEGFYIFLFCLCKIEYNLPL